MSVVKKKINAYRSESEDSTISEAEMPSPSSRVIDGNFFVSVADPYCQISRVRLHVIAEALGNSRNRVIWLSEFKGRSLFNAWCNAAYS